MCAHGYGGRSCVRLLPGKTRCTYLAGGRMGGVALPGLIADHDIGATQGAAMEPADERREDGSPSAGRARGQR